MMVAWTRMVAVEVMRSSWILAIIFLVVFGVLKKGIGADSEVLGLNNRKDVRCCSIKLVRCGKSWFGREAEGVWLC